MTPERWAEIEELFTRALEQPPATRMQFLAEICRDEDTRNEIAALLAEHERAPDFLSPGPWLESGDAATTESHPEQVGTYSIVQLLGRGGMGQVYLAEREAPGFRQRVALKVMRRGLDTDEMIARFRTERQILASLNHANIARLLDVGATAQGLPFFVMEYIEGVPILEYCDSRKLNVRERVALFHSICAAVQHAHRSLIVHRDIKPQNILVTSDGVPKLLDFGIAKILDPTQGGTGAQTQANQLVLTPDYAAPEQVLGEPVTTSCDVYALGVLLYELLCGEHPLRRAGATRSEIQRIIVEEEPKPPSTRVSAGAAEARRTSVAQLQRQLSGDLDNIALKTLRKEPEARYASVLSLAEDLERHFAGHPVVARKATAAYRFRKFVARNRVAVSAAALLALVLTSATGITLYQSRRIREESARVRSERDKAAEVRNYLLEMFSTTGPDQATGDSVTARQLLDRRAATLGNAYANNPELRAEMMYVLAEGYERLGLPAQAEPLARQSLQVRRSSLGANHPDVVASLNLLGWVQHQQRKPDDAGPNLRAAVSLGRQVFPEGDARLARALNDLGVFYEARAAYDSAADSYRQSLAMRRALGGDPNIGLAATTSNLAVVFFRQGQMDSAAVAAQAALELFRRVLGDDHQRTLVTQNNLAAIQLAKGDVQGAIGQYRDIMERRKRLFGERHPFTAFSMSILGDHLAATGKHAEAEQLLTDALSIQRSAEGTKTDLASTLRRLGDLEANTTRPQLAFDHYQESLALTRQALGGAHPNVAVLLTRMGVMRERLGDLRAAEISFRDAAQIAVALARSGNPGALNSNFALIEFLRRNRREAAAVSEFAQFTASLPPTMLQADNPLGRRLRALQDTLAGTSTKAGR